jgi:hypothetical protein
MFHFVIPGEEEAMVSKLDEQVASHSRDDILS